VRDEGSASPKNSVDLKDAATAAGERAGVIWTLDASSDLNANLVRFSTRQGVGEHVNDEVEVSREAARGTPEGSPLHLVLSHIQDRVRAEEASHRLKGVERQKKSAATSRGSSRLPTCSRLSSVIWRSPVGRQSCNAGTAPGWWTD
jgi:hypothetical protein